MMGHRGELEPVKPGTVLPPRHKFRDRYDPCPSRLRRPSFRRRGARARARTRDDRYPLKLEHYYSALITTQARIAAAADRGALGIAPDAVWGGKNAHKVAHALFYGARPSLFAPVATLWVFAARFLYAVAVSRLGRWIARAVCARRVSPESFVFDVPSLSG
jgi:hypothetical protein